MNRAFILITFIVIANVGLMYSAAMFAAEPDNTVYLAQKKLRHKGYDPGPIDGVPGEKTRRAVANFQWDIGLSVTGKLNRLTKKALGILVYGQTQIGAANLKLFDVPVQEWDSEELILRIKTLDVKYNYDKDLTMYIINGVEVHTGQITRIIQNECNKLYENSIGEMYLRGRSILSSRFGNIFTTNVAKKLSRIHSRRANKALKKAREEAVLVCTAAMF